LLDRWLAEEALAAILGSGHKKGNFRKISFKTLREKGLPSLLHRRRLLLHKHIASSFFIWKNYQLSKAYKGMAARPFAEKILTKAPSLHSQKQQQGNLGERQGCL
jgi:hypothetical protein